MLALNFHQRPFSGPQSTGDGPVQFSADNNPYWMVYLNNGSGFSGTVTIWGTPMGGIDFDTGGVARNQGFWNIATTNGTSRYYGIETWNTIDMNGDGIPDLVVTGRVDSAYHGYTVQYGLPTTLYWNVYPGSATTGLQQINNLTANCVLYPNPNNGNFTLLFTDAGERTIEVYDILGRLITPPVAMQNQQQFNLGVINAGIYILRICEHGAMKSIKFVVER